MAVSLSRFRGAHALHLFITVLLLLSGGVLCATGIWLQLLRSGGRYISFYSSSWPFLVLGCVLLVVGLGQLFLLVCLSRERHAAERAATRPPFATAGLLLVLLVVVAVVGIALLASFPTDEARAEAELQWRADVSNSTASVCAAEQAFNCRGFFAGECFCDPVDETPFDGTPSTSVETNATETCAGRRDCAMDCTHSVGRNRSCMDTMVSYVRAVLIPITAVSAALALLLALQLCATCCAADRAAPTEIQPIDAGQT